MRNRFLPLVVLGALSCTEPAPVTDAGPYPYALSPQGVRVRGTTRIVVIPARFADGAAPSISRLALAGQIFDSRSPFPVTTTFALASGNSFRLEGTVTDWIQTSVRYSELAQPGVYAASRLGDYVQEAITGADGQIEFGRYDNDGPDGVPNSGDDDGRVDGGVVLLNSDRNSTCANRLPGKGLHPSTWLGVADSTRWFPTQDARTGGGVIWVNGYVVMGALGCGGQPATNALAHELVHLLFGVLDQYEHGLGDGDEWQTRRWATGCWDLMAAGSGWGCGRTPPDGFPTVSALGAWSRIQIGWSEPIEAHGDTTYTLRSTATGGDVLRLSVSPTDYFLVEYREPVPGDTGIPRNGVLVSHIVETNRHFADLTSTDFRIGLIEADDDDGLYRSVLDGGDRGEASDVFGVDRFSLTAAHSRFAGSGGVPVPFSLSEITLHPERHSATLRVTVAR